MQRPKRVAAVHDLSAFGRCSLSVIMPVLSVMGVQVCAVPTALLSTHTGGFSNVFIQDCEDFPERCQTQWSTLAIGIECIYSGFLGSTRQIEQVIHFRESYKNALLVVDPVLGDHGAPYRTITESLINEMRRLAAAADVITPNPTEAALLLGDVYSEKEIPLVQATDKLIRLAAMGPGRVVITGIRVRETGMCNLCFDAKSQSVHLIRCNYLPVSYPGTGDIFAAVMTGSLLLGESFERAVSAATDFVEYCIKITANSGEDTKNGVFLEPALKRLVTGGDTSRAEPVVWQSM